MAKLRSSYKNRIKRLDRILWHNLNLIADKYQIGDYRLARIMKMDSKHFRKKKTALLPLDVISVMRLSARLNFKFSDLVGRRLA